MDKKKPTSVKDYDLQDIYLWILREFDWDEIQHAYIAMNNINTEVINDYNDMGVDLMKELYKFLVDSLNKYNCDAKRTFVNCSRNFIALFDFYDDNEVTCIYCPESFRSESIASPVKLKDCDNKDGTMKLYNAIINSEYIMDSMHLRSIYDVCKKMKYNYDSYYDMIKFLSSLMVSAYNASKESDYGGFSSSGRFVVYYDKNKDVFKIIFSIEEASTYLTLSKECIEENDVQPN